MGALSFSSDDYKQPDDTGAVPGVDAEDDEPATGALSVLEQPYGPKAESIGREAYDEGKAQATVANKAYDAARGDVQSRANAVRDALRAARENLLQQKYDDRAKYLAMAGALGAPTPGGTFGGALSNAFTAAAPYATQEQQFNMDRDAAARGYGLQAAQYGNGEDALDNSLINLRLNQAGSNMRNAGVLEREGIRAIAHSGAPGRGGTPSPLAKMIAERNALPPGHPDRATYDHAIERASLGSGAATADALPNLTPETQDSLAYMYNLDPGILKTAISGNSVYAGKQRTNTINRSTELLHQAGMGPADLANLRTMYRAENKSIPELVGMQNNIDAFEGLAKNNGSRALELFKKVGSKGVDVPIVNALTRPAAYGLGDNDVAELKLVLGNFTTEAARIISDPKMRGVVSDTARKEVQEMIEGKATFTQAQRAINRLFYEFDSRKYYNALAIQNAQRTAQGGLGAGPAGGGMALPAPAAPPLPPAQGGPATAPAVPAVTPGAAPGAPAAPPRIVIDDPSKLGGAAAKFFQSATPGGK